MVAFCVLWALPGQPSEERPRGPSLVRSAGSSRAGVVLLRMVTAILHCGLRDRGECLLQRGAIGVGCPLDVLVGDVHPGFAHVVMSAHAAAVQTHVRLLSFDGVGDRPRPGANWLGARRRSFRDFALVCGERGENLAILPRRHLEGVEATPEFGRDLVELIRGDVQFAMGLLQPQVGAPGLRRREGERPARGLAQPQDPHELEPGQAVQLPGAPFIQRVVGRPLADLPVLHDGVAEVVHHGCDGEHTTEPLVQALLSHLYVLLPISSWLARHAPVYHTVRSPSPRGSDLASASTNALLLPTWVRSAGWPPSGACLGRSHGPSPRSRRRSPRRRGRPRGTAGSSSVWPPCEPSWITFSSRPFLGASTISCWTIRAAGVAGSLPLIRYPRIVVTHPTTLRGRPFVRSPIAARLFETGKSRA